MAAPLNVVLDLSHHNGDSLDFGQAKQAGIVGIIHKATQGFNIKDKKYETNRQKALAAGLLWGAYHFGVGGDGVEQAKHFLTTVDPGPATLLVLDYEPNTTGRTMTLDQARAFVAHVEAVIGRFPGLYSGHLIKEQLGAVSTPTRCSPSVSYGSRNTPRPRRTSPPRGLHGRFGSTPTATPGHCLIACSALEIATGTNSTVVSTICASCGASRGHLYTHHQGRGTPSLLVPIFVGGCIVVQERQQHHV
jgi:hypothetical protein